MVMLAIISMNQAFADVVQCQLTEPLNPTLLVGVPNQIQANCANPSTNNQTYSDFQVQKMPTSPLPAGLSTPQYACNSSLFSSDPGDLAPGTNCFIQNLFTPTSEEATTSTVNFTYGLHYGGMDYYPSSANGNLNFTANNLKNFSWNNLPSPIGGNVLMMAANPVNAQQFYAGTDTGLFLSADQGNNWTWVPALADATISTIMFSNDGTQIYVGTATGLYAASTTDPTTFSLVQTSNLTPTNITTLNMPTNNGSQFYVGTANGVYSIQNNGNNSYNINLLTPSTGTMGVITTLLNVGNTLYAGTQANGVWSYNNTGFNNNFTQIAGITGGTGTGQAGSITALLNVSGVMYAGTSAGGAYYSTVSNSLMSFNPITTAPADVTALGLSIDNTPHIYAGTTTGIYTALVPSGSTTPVFANIINYPIDVTSLVATDQGMAIGVKPFDYFEVFAAYLSVNGTTPIAIGEETYDYSTNSMLFPGGNNNNLYLATTNGIFYLDGVNTATWNQANIYAERVTAIAGNNGSLYIGTQDDGVFYSPDNGQTYTNIEFHYIGNNPPIRPVVSTLSVSHDGNQIYVGTDQGIFYLLSGQMLVQSTDTQFLSVNKLYHDINGANLYAVTNRGLYQGWYGGIFEPIRGVWMLNVSTLAETDDGKNLFVSVNKAQENNWENGVYLVNFASDHAQKFPGITAPVTSLVLSFDNKTLYAGTDGAGIYYAPVNNGDWSLSSFTLIPGSQNVTINSLVVSEERYMGTRYIYAGASGPTAAAAGVYVSKDGAPFQQVLNQPVEEVFMDNSRDTEPDGTVNPFDGHDRGTVYARTATGIYVSTDNGQDWTLLTQNLPSTATLWYNATSIDDSGNLYAAIVGGNVLLGQFTASNSAPNGTNNAKAQHHAGFLDELVKAVKKAA